MSLRKRLIITLLFALTLLLGASLALALGAGGLPVSQGNQAITGPQEIAALGGWPVLRHDPGHSGYNPDVGSFRPPLAQLDVIEAQEPSGEAFQILDLIAGPQRMYALAQFVLWGIDKTDPTTQWRNDDCVQDGLDFCFNRHMAYTQDRLVVVRQNFFLSTQDFGFELVVLNAATGQEIWSRHLGPAEPRVALQGDEILALVETDAGEGRLLKLLLSGRQEYIKAADVSGASGGAAVLAGGHFVYPHGERILAHTTSDGEFAWDYTPTAHADPHGYDLVATADAVIVSQDDRVIQLATADGAFRWETNVKSAVCATELQPNGAATNGNIVAVTAVCDKEVVALDNDDGTELWRKNLEQVGSAATIAFGGDVLYVAGISVSPQAFTVFALDPADGTELGAIVLDGDDFDTSSVLPIDEGLLLLASNIGSRQIYRYERQPADLAAVLSPASLPVCGAVVGGTVTFHFAVTNNGPGSTDATRADLTLPDGAATLAASQGSCTGGAAPFCDLGPLSNGQTAHITATVTLDTAGSYAPGLTLSDPVRDPDDGDDSAATTLAVGPALPPAFDLLLTDMEITQGIQNLANEIPLVDGKTTFVRVYGKTDGGAVNNVGATLRGRRVGSGEDLGVLTPLPATACLALDDDTPDRDRLSESFVFALPRTWATGGVDFTAEINPDGDIPDAEPANDTLTLTRGFTVLPRICLMTYPVRTTGTRPGAMDATDNLFPSPWSIAEDDGNILSRALTLLPVSEIDVFPSSHLIEEWEFFSYGPYEMEKEDDNRGDVLDTLWWLNLFTDDPDSCDADDSRTHYIGMVHESTDNSVGSAGLGERDGDEAMLFLNTGPNGPQRFDDPHGGLTLAHELGHNYDRGHVDCDDPEDPDLQYPYDPCNIAPIDPRGYYGLEFRDPTSPVVITPTMAGDVMSYADDVWASDYTWRAIQQKLCSENDCTFPALSPDVPVADPPPLSGDVLFLRGWISDTLVIQDLLRLPLEQVPKAQAMWAKQVSTRPLTPTYTVDLLAGQTVLASEPFTPTHAADRDSSWTSFGLVVPWDPATTAVALTADGSTAISLTVSPSPPTVTAVSPNGGETFSDTLQVSWSAADPDGDPLRFNVLYSADGGASWQALASGVETTTLTVDASLLPGSAGQGLVKVVASDGLNSAWRQSADGFSLPDRPARAVIHYPDDGGEYLSGSVLPLRGAAYDPDTGYLPASALSWSLSGAGQVGTGSDVTLAGLADGEYTLTLSAGAQAEHTITFRLGRPLEVYQVYLPAIMK